MYAPGVNKRGTKKPIPHLPQTTLYSQKYTLPHCPSSLHLQRRRKLQRLADPWASQHATKGFRKGKVQRLTWQHSPACSPWVLHQILLGLIIHKNIATSKRTNLGRGVFKAKGPELFCLLGNFGMLLALFRFACSRLLYWVGPSKKRSLCPLTYAVLQSRSLPLPLEGSSSVTAGAAAAGGGGDWATASGMTIYQQQAVLDAFKVRMWITCVNAFWCQYIGMYASSMGALFSFFWKMLAFSSHNGLT